MFPNKFVSGNMSLFNSLLLSRWMLFSMVDVMSNIMGLLLIAMLFRSVMLFIMAGWLYIKLFMVVFRVV